MRSRLILASAVAVAAPLSAVSFVTAAHAATPVTATAVTKVSNHSDSGYNDGDDGGWAVDTFTRTATITLVGADPTLTDCGDTATTCYAYTGTITDTGTAAAITGKASPGAQDVPIKGSPVATMNGKATVTFDASSNTPNATLVPKTMTGNSESTTDWVQQFFPDGVTGKEPTLTAWKWTYADSADCQTWVDELGGTAATSGDITGVDVCPVLSGGKAVSTKTGATITWSSTHTSTFQLTIVGPGKINGHTAKVTKPEAVYSGLSSGHSYTVTIQPLVGGVAEGKAGKITFKTK